MSRLFFLFCFSVLLSGPFTCAAQSNLMRVDIIVTANTTIPPFYNARALPSSGSTMVFTALPIAGTVVPENYSYIWRINGKVQNDGIYSKRNTISFTPNLESEVTIQVDVTNSVGKVLGSRSQVVPISKPEIYFYEVNPLRGLSAKALPKRVELTGKEITIRAEGYYMDGAAFGANIFTEWMNNDQTVATNSTDPYEVTITNETGPNVQLSFHLRNMKNLLQGASQVIAFTF